jgi:hypothetical protein
MARGTMSIVELRQKLEASEKKLKQLLGQRGSLAKQLAALDARIAALGGKAPANGRRKKKAPRAARKRPAAKAEAPIAKAPRKRATGRALAEYITDVLKPAADGMRVKHVMAAVAKAGYATKAKDFYGIVAATLRDDSRFKKISRGVYTIA